MSGQNLRTLSVILFGAAVVTAGIVWSGLNEGFGSVELQEALPTLTITAGPWIVAGLIALVGGVVIDAIATLKGDEI